jgi:hypothetical protein
MARSATLRRWQWGGTNWYSTSLAVKKIFKAADASLLRVWSFGLKPLTEISRWMLSYALTHYEADRDFIGMTLT